MARSRREFLAKGSMGLVAAVVAGKAATGQVAQVPLGPQIPSTPGAPAAFGTSPGSGPEVSVETFVQAEKLVQVEMSGKDLAEAAGNWRASMAAVLERRVGPRKVAIGYDVVPATVWNPLMPKVQVASEGTFSLRHYHSYPLPKNDEDIAYAPVWQLSIWLKGKEITSERLTGIYLERLERFNKELNCVITLTR